MVKTLKNLLLQNLKSYDHETLHGAVCSQALQSLLNNDAELTLTHFKTMSKLAKLVFVLTVGPDIR